MLNRAGMDTISVYGTVAFAIECFESGLLTATDTDGVNPTDIRLSKRVIGDPPQPEGANKGVTVPLEKLRRYYWSAMGFNPETGVPTPECLASLKLEI